jgi:hypothetical protein
MKREILPSSARQDRKTMRSMKTGLTPGLSRAEVVLSQTREDMHKPAMLPRSEPSKYLIKRDTAGRDLSAPPLRPKTAQTQSALAGGLDDEDVRPSTARGDSALVSGGEMMLGL